MQLLGPGRSRGASGQSIEGTMVRFVHDLQVQKSRRSQRVDWEKRPNTSHTRMARIRRHGRGEDGSVPGRRIDVYL